MALDRRSFLTGSLAGSLAAGLGVACAGSGETADTPRGETADTAGGERASDVEGDGGDYVPPPGDDDAWETIDAGEAGWHPDRLAEAMAFAGERASMAVVLLSGGRIVADERFGVEPGYSRDVASVQKSVVSLLVARASQEGLVGYEQSVSEILGAGWVAPGQNASAVARVEVGHLMAMTSGLDTDLVVAADPGVDWLYNNTAYHRLHDVLVAAADTSMDDLSEQWLWGPLGATAASWKDRRGRGPLAMLPDGRRIQGLHLSAYAAARVGLLVARRGRWGEDVVVPADAVDRMLAPSQEMNPSYGELWWLNGQTAHQRPARPGERIDGPLVAGAPRDMVAAMGAGEQRIYVVPGWDAVLVRLGNRANEDFELALSGFDTELWDRLVAARA